MMKKLLIFFILCVSVYGGPCEDGFLKTCEANMEYYANQKNYKSSEYYADIACNELNSESACGYLATFSYKLEQANLPSVADKYFINCDTNGNAKDCYKIGIINYYKNFIVPNKYRFYNFFRDSCKLGELKGCAMAAVCLYDGIGGALQDKILATKILIDTCDKNILQACRALAFNIMITNGDNDQLMKYLIKTCQLGDCTNLEKLTKKAFSNK